MENIFCQKKQGKIYIVVKKKLKAKQQPNCYYCCSFSISNNMFNVPNLIICMKVLNKP